MYLVVPFVILDHLVIVQNCRYSTAHLTLDPRVFGVQIRHTVGIRSSEHCNLSPQISKLLIVHFLSGLTFLLCKINNKKGMSCNYFIWGQY